ncbi:MAG TPA: DUF6049 family protein [Actinomycetota bacterium]|nr:DUF6049 family protein [Actinomycetota bacterium]
MRRVGIFCALATLVFSAALSGAALGQPSSGVEMTLVRQAPWRVPGDPLGIGVAIHNEAAEDLPGYIVTVTAHSRVLSRSELQQSFSTPPTFEASAITALEAPEAPVPAGGTVQVTLDDPVDSLQSLAVATEGGVYPLTITLFDATGTEQLAALTTPLIYYPSPPETPLKIVPIVPVNAAPARGPNGAFATAPEQTSGELEDALSGEGWLRGLVTSLEEVTRPQPPPPPRSNRRRGHGPKPPVRPRGPAPLHLGLAVTPRTLEEIADLSDGFDRETNGEVVTVRSSDAAATAARFVLTQLRSVAARDTVQPLFVPYSYPDLPSVESNEPTHIRDQLNEAESVFDAQFDDAPGRAWVFPPGGRLNADTLAELASENSGQHTFVGERSLDEIGTVDAHGCPEPALSFACAISIETGSAQTTGYALDEDLQLRATSLATSSDPRLALQELFAETSMIREELPSRADRIIALVLPGVWAPAPDLARDLLVGLRDAPWLASQMPAEGLRSVETEQVPLRSRRILTRLQSPADAPTRTYEASIGAAVDELEKFESIQPPASLIQRLNRNVLTSESRSWWGNAVLEARGERFATDSRAEAERELAKITIGDNPSEVRLTSRQAKVPVVVFNEASYPVTLSVHLSSPQLQIDELYPETVQAHSLRQLNVDVNVPAQASGIFPLSVTVEAPDGEPIVSRNISIRSTEFNEIALGLTFGALAFLILFYVTRSLRRRRTGRSEPARA